MTVNEWDQYAQDWEANPQTSLYASNAFAELQKVFHLSEKRVFDFGCGTGLLTEKLSPSVTEIVALDASSKMVDVLERKGLSNVRTISNILNAEFLDEEPDLQSRFDLVVASSVCAFLPDYPETLKLLKTLLVEGGTFVQWDWLVSEGEGGTGFSVGQVETKLAAASFIDIQTSVPFEVEGMQVLMAVAQNP